MDLERLALRLRPRNAWEALDLGIELVRAHGRAVYAAWFAAYLPVAVIVFALLWKTPFWAWVVMWWLKPLFDRIALSVVSTRLFGEGVSTRATLRMVPAILWRSGIIGALTWRRLDLARSFHLPVRQLERLTGRNARARVRVLDRDARPAAVWLTFLLANMEMLFGLAISLAAEILTPAQAPLSTLMEGWWRGQFEGGATGAIVGLIAACFIEPFYVACGFTLYLQRRTMLEGWDIELRFRQLTDRVEKAKSARAAAATLASLVVATVLALAMPLPSHAADVAAKDPAKEIREVLREPDFGRKDTVTRIKYVGPTWKGKSESKPMDWTLFGKISRWVGQAVRALAWVAGGLLLLIVLYYVARYIRLHGLGRVKKQRPDFLFGLDVRPESLPDDVAATAQELATEGRIREALSLLYRGSLVRFMDAGIEFFQGDTEGDCMRRVEAAQTPRRKAYFQRLVAHWEVLAYGHHAVSIETAVALARAWREQFPAEAPEGAGATPQAA